MEAKIDSITICPNPAQVRLRAHKRLGFMVEARFENGAVERKYFAEKKQAKQWVGRQFFLGNIVLNKKEDLLKKDEDFSLH